MIGHIKKICEEALNSKKKVDTLTEFCFCGPEAIKILIMESAEYQKMR